MDEKCETCRWKGDVDCPRYFKGDCKCYLAKPPASPGPVLSDLLYAFVAGAVWREKYMTGKEMSIDSKKLALSTAECMKAAGVISYVTGM